MRELLPDDLSQVVHPGIPAAGNGFTYAPSGANFTRIRMIGFTLTTSSASANRTVSVSVNHVGSLVLADIPSPATQTASQADKYVFGIGLFPYSVNAAAAVVAPLPDLWLRLGQSVTVAVANIDTGDAFSRIVLVVDQIGFLEASGED